MSHPPETVTLTIDNRTLEVSRGTTILEAARRHDVYIPSLCASKGLTPFGGCRLCIVEVEGMRGLPTACTTPVEPGMVVRTHTVLLHDMRREILQLILSEHPCSCLVCDEGVDCRNYSTTIRKVGVTTGCRWCPNDGRCELQDVAEYLNLKEINYPVSYRNLPVEKNDPFYDRDYNLCILCGRCVRVCQEVRAAGTLTFCRRGHHTVIGTAFGRSHLEAGCEFCGACVEVCPTGALSEKASKWDGKADREVVTTCPLCGVGCQLRLLIKNEEIIGTLPADDELINKGQLCVKGRFCVSELVNGHRRVTRPFRMHEGLRTEIAWPEALDRAAGIIAGCAPDEFAMLVSPDATNEDLYVAQKFARTVVGTHQIDTSARLFYGSALNSYLRLLTMSVPLAALDAADAVLCIGLDTRFGRSVVGVELRRAVRRGARIVSIHPRSHNLSFISDQWLQPAPGTELSLLRALAELCAGRACAADPDIRGAADLLREARQVVIMVGSEYMAHADGSAILDALAQIAVDLGAAVMALPAQSNLVGSLLVGAYPELLPGGRASGNAASRQELATRWDMAIRQPGEPWTAADLSPTRRMKVLYLLGTVVPAPRTLADAVVFQNIYPPEQLQDADLVLPAAAFTEVDGSLVNGEGRVQPVRQAVKPPGSASPHWEILCRLARHLGRAGFDFGSAQDVREEIAALVPDFGDPSEPARRPGLLPCGDLSAPFTVLRHRSEQAARSAPYILSISPAEHIYHGYPLARWVEGAATVFDEGTLEIGPDDAGALGLAPGDRAIVTAAEFERTWPVRILREQQPGTAHVVLPPGQEMAANPYPVTIRKAHV